MCTFYPCVDVVVHYIMLYPVNHTHNSVTLLKATRQSSSTKRLISNIVSGLIEDFAYLVLLILFIITLRGRLLFKFI